MPVSPEDLARYFEQYGSTYTQHSEDIWITGVRTPVSTFQIFVRLTDEWVFFFINPFVVAPTAQADRLRFYYHALRYNHDMNLAKLGIDADGDLFMIVELPADGFQYSQFIDAMNALMYHADAIYLEMLNLAHDSDAVGRYDAAPPGKGAASKGGPAHRSPDHWNEADDSDDDVIIGGRRLKIMRDENGNPRIELDPPEDDAPFF